MIKRWGPRDWANIHLTERTHLADLVSVTNLSAPGHPVLGGFDLLVQTARDIDGLLREARGSGRRVRALGSGWALTDIAITDGLLLDTKALNGSFDVSDKYFHPAYPAEKRHYVVVSQCGASIGELNVYLETTRHSGLLRSLKTAGVGAGQTVAGSFSGNTHGAAIKFGSSPDYVVGLQLVTGRGRSLWLERASYPVMADSFMTRLDADAIRDDDVFNAALVSFGSFGVITAVAIETDPIYHLKFPPVREVTQGLIEDRVKELASTDPADPGYPYHYEFVFNPYDRSRMLEASATLAPYEPVPTPKPVWIVRDRDGFAMGDRVPVAILGLPIVPASVKAKFQLTQYRERAILDNVRGTPGQLFTATITYFEGYTESAVAVSIDDVPRMIEVSSEVIKAMRLPAICQVRLVHPTRALLGFTSLAPKTAVFEWGLVNDHRFLSFEENLRRKLNERAVSYRFHWSKNSGISHATLREMYGDDRITRWKSARERVFGGDQQLMDVFSNAHLERAGLTA